MIKKIISLAVMLLLVSNIIVLANDIDNTPYEKPVKLVSALGIMGGYKDGSFKAENFITSAEFAAVIGRIAYAGETPPANNESIFKDVPANHWAAGYSLVVK